MVGDGGRPPGQQTPRPHDVEERRSFWKSSHYVMTFFVCLFDQHQIAEYINAITMCL